MSSNHRTSTAPAGIAAYPELALLPEAVAGRARLINFDAGDVVFRNGEPPRGLYYVIHGELMLVRHSKSGQQIILQRTRAGFFAEASVESGSYHCDGVARAKSRAYVLPMEAFKQALARDPAFHAAWRKRLAGEIRRLRAQCERLALRSAQERIVHFIESEGSGGTIELDRSLKSWALDLGLTHETLYRALAHMAQSGKLVRTALRLRLAVPRKPG